ncbi:MAG: OmpA family protein [Gammaproteobacteria bacterium]|nr:OmpA family protein [Gammaproteobacteria bacterium]
MIRPIAITSTLIIFATNGWATEVVSKSTYESVGIGSGAAIGAVAGGPVGLVFGAAMGALLGDLFDTEHNARTQAEKRWTELQAEVKTLNSLVEGRELAVASLEAQLHDQARQIQSTVTEALDVKVLFMTNESNLPSIAETRLLRLAELLTSLDDTSIQIDGHTDSRGKLTDNQELAEQRVSSVREVLIRGGVPISRIVMNAHGEAYASATENDVDAMAMERRVDLTLIRNVQDNRVAQQ